MIFKILRQSLQAAREPVASPAHLAGHLSILSHNVGQDLPDYHGLDTLICEVGADIVLLQEITREYVDRHWANLLQTYPYLSHGPFREKKHVASGILSKYPLLHVDTFKLADIGIVPQ